MKRIISVILIACMCISLSACGGNQKAFKESKLAYDEIDKAYEITAQYGSDIYEAWRLGIYDDDEVLKGGAAYLAKELSLSVEEIKEGAAYALAELVGENWADISEDKKKRLMEDADDLFKAMKDNLFTFCVFTVNGAYALNGKADEAQTALAAAKTQMRELSEKYSDYEHYPNLKGFYTTTSAFFDFCQNPTGSFEQVKDTINKYNNEARDYISDLNYIFEE